MLLASSCMNICGCAGKSGLWWSDWVHLYRVWLNIFFNCLLVVFNCQLFNVFFIQAHPGFEYVTGRLFLIIACQAIEA